MKFTMYQHFLVVIFLLINKKATHLYVAATSNDISIKLKNSTLMILPDDPHQSCSNFDQFSQLENGVCKLNDYKPHVMPNRKQTIIVTMKRQKIQTVNDKTNRISINVDLTLHWTDSRIITTFDVDTMARGYIPLSPKAIDKIWTPDIYVFNLSDYKSFVDSQHISSVKIIQHFHPHFHFKHYFPTKDTIIEYKIEFRAPVYCQFDFTNYPRDKTFCRFIFGSQYSNIQYVIVDGGLKNNQVICGRHRCKMTLTNTTLDTSSTFKNRVGVEIEIERILRPFIYRYFLPCFWSVLVSSLSMTIPTNLLQARVAMSVTLLLININLYVTQMVSNYCLTLLNQFYQVPSIIIDYLNSLQIS